MWVRILRLGLAVFFLLMAGALFLRHTLFPDALPNLNDRNLFSGRGFALVLGGWNLARWYTDWAARRNRVGVNPLDVRVVKPVDREPNPAFDFTEPGHPPPRPSTNGDQH